MATINFPAITFPTNKDSPFTNMEFAARTCEDKKLLSIAK